MTGLASGSKLMAVNFAFFVPCRGRGTVFVWQEWVLVCENGAFI